MFACRFVAVNKFCQPGTPDEVSVLRKLSTIDLFGESNASSNDPSTT